MKKNVVLIFLGLFFQMASYASLCPTPEKGPLSWGEIPSPWGEDPFSAHSPQGEKGTQFLRANILVRGFSRGIVCTYKNSLGEFSIWWPTLAKIPTSKEDYWMNSLGGFLCTQSREACAFQGAAIK